ncbi:PepSY-associated TM helix domain-containing protein [Hydrogenophaga sp. 2FB]|uniref:PepSY-associated TM helix domain-containing protein n=1 Tax=Hydrogenophaga sp. 2FB TaxID=2502187 RepID=UPI0010F86C76|nr:PepSY-associated TM helix domain-containing protein [Hydrogenophaga sp. 2FB]
MAWLHTWCGLWFSWLLFAVFLTGTLAVFAEPITHWMTPEHHAEEEREAEEAARAPTSPAIPRGERLARAVAFMAEHHPTRDMWEIWPSDATGEGRLSAYWFDEKRLYVQAVLEPATGAEVPPPPREIPVRGTTGGQHFVEFHYNLHGGTLGLWVVAIAAMTMLVALVSGVITHRRIFKDFFTFRTGKGQRSWLDAHNAVAVLSLPFQFMIAYTGIVFTATNYLPAGVMAHYGASEPDRVRYIADLQSAQPHARTGTPMAVPNLEPFAARAEALMGQPVRAVVVDHPGDAGMRIGVYGWNDAKDLERRMSAASGMVEFLPSGEVLRVRHPGGAQDGGPSFLSEVMGNLHMAGMGGWVVKWFFFLCGLAGTAMMGTGAVLFMVKRRTRSLGEFGARTPQVYRAIEGLNIAAIAGLALACAAYLWANRLVPLSIEARAGWEIRVFFAVWMLSLVHALWRAPARAWVEQLGALAALCLLLPVLNLLATGDQVLAQLVRGDGESAGVELIALAFGALAACAACVCHRRCTSPSRGATRARRASVEEAA